MSTQDPIFTAIRNRLLHQLEQDKLVLPSLPLLLKMAARHEHRQALEP